MFKRLWFIVIIALIAVIVTFIVVRKKPVTTNQVAPNSAIIQVSPSTEPTQEPPPSPTPVTKSETESPTEYITTAPGVTSGNLTCNYLIPAAPNRFGTVSIDTTWNNLIPGTNGKYKADLCVTADGGATQTLMTSKTKISGVSTETADWISLSSDYTFTFFDEHGGELPQCGGIVLSSCQIHTQHISTPAPIRSR